MSILFASHRPGYVFAISGGDIIFRDLMFHLRRRGVDAELHGAGDVVKTWALGPRRLHARLKSFGCKGRLRGDRLVYRSVERDFGEGTLFASAEAQLAGLDEGLRAGRWRCVITQYAGADLIAARCLAHGVPVYLYVQDWDIPATKNNVRFFVDQRLPILALSRYLQRSIRAEYGYRSRLLYPKMDYSQYRVARPRSAGYVTITHAHAVKGLDMFLHVAQALPTVPFLVVDGWGGWVPMPSDVARAIAEVPNVRLIPSQDDMRSVYAMTKILTVPSVWNEAFARVVLEAEVNGIPVIASRRGGLPESVGDGGFVIGDHRNPDRWISAVRRLLEKPDLYREVSARARAHAASFSVERRDPALLRLLAG